MVSKDGGWGAFDADNTRELRKELPFCDFGAVIDPPSADVTAHVVEMLAYEAARGASGLAGVIEEGSAGSSDHRRPMGPGSGGGAPTTSTASAP